MNGPLDQDMIDRLTVKKPSKDQTTDVEESTPDMMSEEEMTRPGIQEALVAEINDAAKRATEYKQEMDEAKTSTKREHFRKKLKQNNENAADMIVALERVIQVRKAREQSNNDSGDSVQDGPREEPSN